MAGISRRSVMAGGAATIGASIAGLSSAAQTEPDTTRRAARDKIVQFIGDGISHTPAAYAKLLQELTQGEDNIRDSYGQGGAVRALEEKFAAITGKEKAIYMPTGTMANQLAMKVLSGNKSKVLVQDNSHYYRDEADAAQVVHGRRLLPVMDNSARFNVQDVKAAIDGYRTKEYFNTDVGAIAIENPVRRSFEEVFDLEAIKEISTFARDNSIGMHLDGARLYMASGYTGVSIKEYSRYFDTVYISLYKYLGAGSGAILSGPADIIDRMPNLIKVYGGNTAQSWSDAIVALHTLDGFEDRFARAKQQADAFFADLNKMTGLRVSSFDHGSNVFKLSIDDADSAVFRDALRDQKIYIRGYDENAGFIPIKVNETILAADNAELLQAFGHAYNAART